MLIYLADLSHTGVSVATEAFPLNIGVVGAYAKQQFGDAIELRLFKYPDALLAALKANPPDLLGCSNYVWNSNLAEWMLGRAKQLRPDVVTVQGGTNYPFKAELQADFLRTHPNTDFYVFYEGELAFVELVKRYLETGSAAGMKEAPIAGMHFLASDGTLVAGPSIPRLKSLDTVPSPYVTGLLDSFFDGRLTPMIETTRGCPFSCNFCNAGEPYYTKISAFSIEYIRAELEYIAPRIAAAGVPNLWIADNNFGMFPRDADICRVIRDLQERYKWPLGILATTGKNNKQRIIDTTEILGKSLSVSVSPQSMTHEVLVNIKRDNIKLETYGQVNQALHEQGRSSNAEIIFPLPGETIDSFLDGIRQLTDAGTGRIGSFTLMLLHGTDYKDPEYRRRWGYETRWRLIPQDFGEYEGERIFDVEEVAVASSTATFSDYMEVRAFSFITEVLYNDAIFAEILRYLRERGFRPFDLLQAVWERRARLPANVASVLDSFLAATRDELWNSEAELRAFYSTRENYGRLVRGELGGNLIFRHKAWLLTQYMAEWIEFTTQTILDLICADLPSESARTEVEFEVEEIGRFLSRRLVGVLAPDEPIDPTTDRFEHDILEWSRRPPSTRLADVRGDGVEYRFYFSEGQLSERADNFRRYGTGPHGLAKIFTRAIPLSRLFRHVDVASQAAAEIVADAIAGRVHG